MEALLYFLKLCRVILGCEDDEHDETLLSTLGNLILDAAGEGNRLHLVVGTFRVHCAADGSRCIVELNITTVLGRTHDEGHLAIRGGGKSNAAFAVELDTFLIIGAV